MKEVGEKPYRQNFSDFKLSKIFKNSANTKITYGDKVSFFLEWKNITGPTVNGYFPAESDENEPNFIRRTINVNFYAGPGFDGYSFKGPAVPFSTSGKPEMVKCPDKCEWDPENSVHADCKCTQSIKIPLGSIVEFQLTGSGFKIWEKFHLIRKRFFENKNKNRTLHGVCFEGHRPSLPSSTYSWKLVLRCSPGLFSIQKRDLKRKKCDLVRDIFF